MKEKTAPEKREFSISEFAALMGVSRQTLIYYDRIGLFRPARVDRTNGYRRYTHQQISVLSAIQTLAELGLSLREIGKTLARISPDRAAALLRKQQAALAEERRKLAAREAMIDFRLRQLEKGRAAHTEAPPEEILLKEALPFFLRRLSPCRRDAVPDEAYLDFYLETERAGIPFGYPLAFLTEEDALRRGRADETAGIAFRLGSGEKANFFLPPGRYLAAWGRGGYGSSGPVYEKILAFAAKEGFRVAGCGMEEYVLDEMTCGKEADFLCRCLVRAER